jgi:hypothetical protein
MAQEPRTTAVTMLHLPMRNDDDFAKNRDTRPIDREPKSGFGCMAAPPMECLSLWNVSARCVDGDDVAEAVATKSEVARPRLREGVGRDEARRTSHHSAHARKKRPATDPSRLTGVRH